MLNNEERWAWAAAWLIVASCYLSNIALYHRWQDSVTSGGDSYGYYVYLPALFIHHDLTDLQQTTLVRESMHPGTTWVEDGLRRIHEAPQYNGTNVIKYTYGVALMHAPAFFIAHVFTSLTHISPADGFSRPYILALYLNTILYIILGLFLVSRVLEAYFSDKTVMVVVILLALATNLFYFGVVNNVMSHPVLFFLWSSLIYFTHRYYLKRSAGLMALIGLSAGLITVIRPVECFCVLIPCFYGLKVMKDIVPRLRMHVTLWWRNTILGMLCAVLVIFPQLLYWKKTTGQWFFYSYPGEHFDFGNPHIVDGMFSFMNGWLVYTPVMIFSLVGFYFLWKMMRMNAYLFFVLFLIHIYIIYSWWNWYYINGFGSRPMVDIYPMLALPLAACIQRVLQSWTRYVFIPLWIALICLNVFQMYQISQSVMISELANRAYYLQSFGKTRFTKPLSVALDVKCIQHPDLKIERTLMEQDFEDETGPHISTVRAASGANSYLINTQDSAEQMKIEIPYDSLKAYSLRQKYIVVDVMVFVERQVSGFYNFDVLFVDFMRGSKIIRQHYLRLNNKTGDDGEYSIWWGETHQWHPLIAQIAIPKAVAPGDHVLIHTKNMSPNSIVYIDDLEISFASR